MTIVVLSAQRVKRCHYIKAKHHLYLSFDVLIEKKYYNVSVCLSGTGKAHEMLFSVYKLHYL